MRGIDKNAARYAAEQLRKARDLMNHGGRHWIKGAERQLIDPEIHSPGDSGWNSRGPSYLDEKLEPAFCSIGALHEIDADSLATITLGELLDPQRMKDTRAEILEDIETDREYYVERDLWWDEAEAEYRLEDQLRETAEDIIVGFNDSGTTSWDDVRSAFTKAAKRLADRARR